VKPVFALSLCVLCLTGSAGVAAGQPPADAGAAADTEADARWQRLQAERATEAARRREAQESYERGVREAAVARARYEADLARNTQEVARAREAQADYERRQRDYEAQTGGQAAQRGSRSAERETREDRRGARTENERCQRRARGRGRLLGGIAGGIAGGIVGRGSGAAAALATALPVSLLVGEVITRLLDCREQEQAAAATETAVTQAAEAGAERGVGTSVPWTSETRPGVTGSSVVTALDSEPGGAQCMTVTDIVIVDGEETRAPKRMCRRPPSQRFVRV